jgi:hypothetical protein
VDALDAALWSFPVAYALHVAQEAPGFAAWARRHASPDYTQRDFARINAFGMVSTLATTALAARGRRGFALHHASITQQAVWNPVFHAVAGAPGLATAAGAVLPAWAAITAVGLRRGLLTRRGVAWAVALGAPIHSAAVWATVYRTA